MIKTPVPPTLKLQATLKIEGRLEAYRRLHTALKQRGDEVRWVHTALQLGRDFERAIRYGKVFGRFIGLSRRQIVFIESGNRTVFEDAHRQIFELLEQDPLRGQAAQDWDHRILDCEQARMQAYYDRLAQHPDDLRAFEKRLKSPSFIQRQALPTLTKVPFRGTLLNVDDRIDYGLRMMYPEHYN